MDITVKSKYLKISPRKMRPVLFGVRGSRVDKLLETLPFVNREAANYIYELVKSGVAAAKENDIEAGELQVKSICCNEGPRLKRRRFKARGRVAKITKRMCHLTLTVTNDQNVVPEAKVEANEIKTPEKTEKPKAKASKKSAE